MATKKVTFQDVLRFDFNAISFAELTKFNLALTAIVDAKREEAKNDFFDKLKTESSQLGLDLDALISSPDKSKELANYLMVKTLHRIEDSSE